MLNYIWLGLILLSVMVGGARGVLGDVSAEMISAAKTAVISIALPLGGIITLWLGIIRLVERSGMIMILGRALRPLMRLLFPDVPKDHPAIGAITLNMGANMLGAGNAATPLGLRAMQHLARLSPHPGTATNAMCTFLAINTSSVTLIPATAVGILATAGATDPTSIIAPAILATLASTIVAVTAVKLLAKLPVFAVPPEAFVAEEDRNFEDAGEDTEIAEPVKLGGWRIAVLWAFAAAFVVFYLRMTMPDRFGAEVPDWASGFERWVNPISALAMPFVVAFFPLHAALSGVKVFEEFAEGAKEGMQVALRIIPFLVGIYCALSMLRASGFIEWMAEKLGPVLGLVGFPPELLPMALIRPLTGSGSQAVLVDITTQYGGDHILSKMAATMFGSTETTLYVLAVYFGAVAVRKTRHALAAGLTADLAGAIAAVAVCKLVF